MKIKINTIDERNIKMNEILLVVSLLVIYGFVLLFYRMFGLSGLYVWSVIATILANIEVLILIDAFGMEQTLGNVMFASSFLVSDIVSELYSKKEAIKTVNIGIMTSVVFICCSQIWLLYTPSVNDTMMESMKQIFSNTPRILITSLLVYVIVQRLDIYLYHKLWDFTTKKCGNERKFLWIRNNFSTLVTQFVNITLFNLGSFVGVYDTKTLISIIIFGYIVYVVTSLLDTPYVYIARKMFDKRKCLEAKGSE